MASTAEIERESEAEADRSHHYREARSLYWRGWRITQIAEELDIPRTTLHSWRSRHKWSDAPAIRVMEDSAEIRFATLMAKETLTGHDYKLLDSIGRQVERFARVRKYEQADGHEGHLNPKISKRNKAARAKQKRNHFTAEQVEKLRELLEEMAFAYQLTWWSNVSRRTRMILKSRQIGATYFFALEALVTALQTGNNQIFLSASKAQAHIFKTYITGFGTKVGVKLQGDPMIITSEMVDDGETAIELHFLGTNARTAQGYHGDFYFDEFFWVFGFEQLNKVASGMAMQKKYRRTYMSTPSTVGHEAYPYWTGERKNRNRKKADKLSIDTSHEALKDGQLCEDKTWRQIVTIEDAEAGGCDLFDIDELRDEYAPDEYANLLMCEFVDDSHSAFKFNDLVKCRVDSWVEWDGFKPLDDRPVGNRAVWAGYDPQESEDGDNAALVIALPPETPGGKFRVVERHQLRGLDFQQQSEFIKAVFAKYNVTYFGVDASGVGAGVYQLVRVWYPRATKIEYSLEVKARLVMKAQNVIRKGRVEWDLGWTDMAASFLAIKKTLTARGGQLTFKADRSAATGHADLAWSLMHILDNEPLDENAKKGASIEIFGGSDDR